MVAFRHPDRHSTRTTSDESVKGGDRQARTGHGGVGDVTVFGKKGEGDSGRGRLIKQVLAGGFGLCNYLKNLLISEGEK
jgi:hypothetical protein